MVADTPVRFKHAFVTGATGIVGVPLCEKLTEIGVRVTAYSRTTGDFGLPSVVRHARGDILDPAELAKAAAGSDVVFHLAAAVHGSASTLADFERMNVTGTENVILVASEAGARLIHVSTVNVDGFRQGTLTDAYATTKARAEELVLDAVKMGFVFSAFGWT
ncbi:MAG: NAD-dependent epimerase/dehydratase family protein, partial [Chloroflexi bacterium]|nr:NAD-dependent epimerase/dehydratase family protein [Chloroflexota bacterium]